MHRRRQLFKKFVLERLHDFRIELFTQCGETAEIGKQHGNGTAIRTGFGFYQRGPDGLAGRFSRPLQAADCRRIGDLGSAFWAEHEVWWAQIFAVGARAGLFRATFWAKRKTALNVKTATRAVHRYDLTGTRMYDPAALYPTGWIPH